LEDTVAQIGKILAGKNFVNKLELRLRVGRFNEAGDNVGRKAQIYSTHQCKKKKTFNPSKKKSFLQIDP